MELIQNFPKGHADIADQLRRACPSIPFNIAEAGGKNSPADTKRYFAIARGSALECGAILDVCAVLNIANKDSISTGKNHPYEIVSMLSKLCR